MSLITNPSRSAFTLTEMIVTVAIITLLMGLALSGLPALIASGGTDAAVNSLSAQINAARGIAQREQTDAAVIITRRDIGTDSTEPLIYLAIREEDTADPLNVRFIRFEDRGPLTLAEGLEIRIPDMQFIANDSDSVQWRLPEKLELIGTDPEFIMIWFAPDGSIKTNEAGANDIYFDEDDNGIFTSSGPPQDQDHELIAAPLLAIYNAVEPVSEGVDLSDQIDVSDWINANVTDRDRVRVLTINRFTGQVMTFPEADEQ